MVSHELRAPLTSIKGSAATLLSAADLDPAEMRAFFRLIDEQADHVRGLLGDLLDVGRIVQVLNNLFSNASLHAPETSPIRVAAHKGSRPGCIFSEW